MRLSELRIVLLGGRVTGKSSSGNTILGREAFKTGDLTETGTVGYEKSQGEVAGRQVTVVRAPGWGWSDSVQETLKQFNRRLGYKLCCFFLTGGRQTASPETQRLSELRIVLLEGRRTGKSSSGNTILGRKAFKTGRVTVQSEKSQDEVAGRQVTVVDTQGWWRSHSVQETPERVKQEIVRSVSLCPPGPHALLLVINVWSSFTERERRSVQEHLELLSERVWRHTIVLFTWGDRLGDTTIEQHIERGGEGLQRLVEKCGNRYHVLHNRNRGDGTQVTELLDKIEEMVAGLSVSHYRRETGGLQEKRVKRSDEREGMN
ncbi:GIMA4 GTPase, partial [Amia calva]|nr:GIMA4 GTPase [Amia calva]